jgi:uncharacterized membrane protein YobD (UPF0266 family)
MPLVQNGCLWSAWYRLKQLVYCNYKTILKHPKGRAALCLFLLYRTKIESYIISTIITFPG